MGQKVHPTGMRLGIVEQSKSKWYSKNYAKTLHEDLSVRKLLEEKLSSQASVSRIDIERPARSAKVTIHSARPGVIIGKSGKELEVLRREVSKLLNLPSDAPVHINVEEIRKPDIDAKLVAENIAQQLVKRIAFRRAMKRAISTAIRSGAKGVKVCVGGRLGGAEIARSEWSREGRIPLHTLRAEIDYGTAEAKTTYGIIGVKVWIFKGEVLGDNEADGTSTSGKAAKKRQG